MAPPPAAATPAPEAAASTGGTVSVPVRYVQYSVAKDRVTGFKKRTLDAPLTAPADAPRTYRMETFSDPDGTKTLVRITAGPLEGSLVSPYDPGVSFAPG